MICHDFDLLMLFILTKHSLKSLFFNNCRLTNVSLIIAPTLKNPLWKRGALHSPHVEKGGLYWVWVVCLSVCLFVRHNFISTQYLEKKLIEFHQIFLYAMILIDVRILFKILFPLNLENKRIEFHQILYMHWYWQDLCWDCYLSFFAHLYQSYGPWLRPKFCLRSISWEQIDRISPFFYESMSKFVKFQKK